MARREDILVEVVKLLKAQRSVRLGVVERDPIDPNQLAKTAFPAVYIETTDEEITDITMTMGSTGLERMGELEIAVILIIENTLMEDRTLTNTVEDIRLSRVETVTTSESAPFASCRMVFTTEYCYQLNNT